MFKLLQKEKVLTVGSGPCRVVLCYDSGLCYQYQNPSNVLAVYERGHWSIPESPYYSRGGWGRGSRGDMVGHTLIENTKRLLKAIGAGIRQYNIPELLSPSDYSLLIKKIDMARRIKTVTDKLKLDVNLPTLKGKTPYMAESRGKGQNIIQTFNRLNAATQVFIQGKGKTQVVDGYTISTNSVEYGPTIVAFRDKQKNVFMNSQLLNASALENTFLGGESPVQKAVKKIATFSMPFNVLEAGQLKLAETKIVEQGPESTHTIQGVSRHFTGALLLENAGRKFLMDIDRIEIEHGIFNVFFVEVSASVSTITEAYDSMKPDLVKQAESQGIEVKRQGEWFFVATDKKLTVPAEKIKDWFTESESHTNSIVAFNISHGKGRPNRLFKPLGFDDTSLSNLVCGIVSHTGREHKDLNLGITQLDGRSLDRMPHATGEARFTFDLWQVVPNTTISNFTITGDVD